MKKVYLFLLYSSTNLAYSSDNFLEYYLPVNSVEWRWRKTSSQIRSAITLNRLAQVKQAIKKEHDSCRRASDVRWLEDSETYVDYAIKVKASVDIILHLLESENISNLEKKNRETLLELLLKESKTCISQPKQNTMLLVEKIDDGRIGDYTINEENQKKEKIFKTVCALLDCNTRITQTALEVSKETPLENLLTANLFDASENTALTTMLHNGSQYHTIQNVKMCIGQGNYPVNRHKNLTALHLACFSESYAMTKLLIDKGAQKSINQICQGYTPLYIAVVYNNRDIARLLLENGANQSLSIETQNGQTPLSTAERKGHSDMVTLLKKYQS